MENSKHQDPSSRETSSSRPQQDGPRVGSLAWWDQQPSEGATVLKDEPNNRPEQRHPFDLEERTAVFGENIVRFSKKIPRSPANDRLIDQLVGCGTSIGGNYREANEGVSKRDFRH